MNYIIENCTLVDNNEIKTIIIENGYIRNILDNLSDFNKENYQVIDAKGLYLSNGLFDLHTHFREPGFEYKEDIESGAKSAVMGGFTAVAVMPNTKPICDNTETVKYVLDKAKKAGFAKVYPIVSITIGSKGEKLTSFADLKKAGAVAVSDDGLPIVSTKTMRNALILANENKLPLISHCEDLTIAEGLINEGKISKQLGVKGIPRIAEDLIVARECLLAYEYSIPVHIAHISTKNSVEIVRFYKNKGAKITAETCPHYFSLTEEAVLTKGTNAKMNPPLRTKEDVNAVIEGIKDDTIDIIVTDHAPHSKEEKDRGLEKAPNGIVGLETSLAVGITYLVKPERITLKTLIEKMCYAPLNIIGKKRSVKIGEKADLLLFNPNEEYTVIANNFKSKSRNTPYDNEKLFGVVYFTFVDGKMVVKNKELVD